MLCLRTFGNKHHICTLVDMVATITTGYRTTSTAPPGGWWCHILNVGTCCHTSLHNFGSKRIFSVCFQICIQEMLTDWPFNTYQHFSQVKMQNCGNDKKNYHKCHLNGYNIEFDKIVLNFSCIYPEASSV